MNCEEIRSLYEEYASKILPEEKLQEIEKHLNECQVCKQEYEENKTVAETLKVNAFCTIDNAYLSRTISKVMERIDELSSYSLYDRILLFLKERLSIRRLGFATMFIVIGFLIGIIFQLYNQQKTPIFIIPSWNNNDQSTNRAISPIALNNYSTMTNLPIPYRDWENQPYRIIFPTQGKKPAKSAESSNLTTKEKQLVANIEKLSEKKPIDIDNAIKKGPEESKGQVAIVTAPMTDAIKIDDVTALYNKAEEYTSQGKYFDALREFQNVIRTNPMNLLASKSLYNIANIEFNELYDFEGALKDFQKYLDYYPDKYISKEIKEEVLEKIKLLTQNSQDDWASLKIFLTAQKVEPSQSVDYYSTVINNYPRSGLAEKSIDNLISLAINSYTENPKITEETLLFMQNYISSQTEADPLFPKMQLGIGDIVNYGLKDKEQALIEYSKITKNFPATEFGKEANVKIQDIYRRVAKEERL